MTETQIEAPERVECPAGRDPAVRLFIVVAMLLAFGLWALYDLHVAKKFSFANPTEDIQAFGKWAANAFGAYICTPASVVLAMFGLSYLRRVLVADESGIGYAGKPKTKIPWDKITSMDASQLKPKGILVLHAGEQKLKLDSWKLQNFRELMAIVDKKVPLAVRAQAADK